MKTDIARIREDEINNLSISWNREDGFILLFTPDMQHTPHHYHIELSDEQIKSLRSFIDCYV